MIHAEDTLSCWTNHLGIWAIEPLWFQQAFALFREGIYDPGRFKLSDQQSGLAPRSAMPKRDTRPYTLYDHTAIIPIEGPITKGDSKFSGASTLRIGHMIHSALQDTDVQSLLYHIDSPGGHVAGIQQLADRIYKASFVKPSHAHIDDLGASAAYWLASQASHISATPTTQVGSIGTMIVLEDSSKRYERLGIEVKVIATGKYKGLGVEGTKMTKEGEAYLQSMVDGINQHFLTSILRGRRTLSSQQLMTVADGRTFLASEALRYGLIDSLQSFEDSALSMRHALPMTATTSLQEWLTRHI